MIPFFIRNRGAIIWIVSIAFAIFVAASAIMNITNFLTSLNAIKDFIVAVVGVCAAPFAVWIGFKVVKINNVQKSIHTAQEAIVEKVDNYHKEVNGKMEKLLETTDKLGQAKGKEKERNDQKRRDEK